VTDSVSKRRYLVDTGASFSVLPFYSPNFPSGPRLSGPDGASIPCWGYRRQFLVFGRRRFVWRFLLAAVKFPIIGVDFLKHFCLLVDPAGQQLVDATHHDPITATATAAATSTAATALQVTTCGDILPLADKRVEWSSSAATAVQVATCGDQPLADKQVGAATAAATGRLNALQQQLVE
jgi:hypothetical protein